MLTLRVLGRTCLSVFILSIATGAGQMPKSPPVVQPPARPSAPPFPVEVTGRTQVPLNAAKLQGQAEQLANLAKSIPGDVEKAAKGQLVQDLGERLKRIEKLSRELRRELST